MWLPEAAGLLDPHLPGAPGLTGNDPKLALAHGDETRPPSTQDPSKPPSHPPTQRREPPEGPGLDAYFPALLVSADQEGPVGGRLPGLGLVSLPSTKFSAGTRKTNRRAVTCRITGLQKVNRR